MSMCLGVSPSSNSMEVDFLSTAEVVRLLGAGRDFLVILWKGGRHADFKRDPTTTCPPSALSLLDFLTSRNFCFRLRLSKSCGVLAPASLSPSLLLRLGATVLKKKTKTGHD